MRYHFFLHYGWFFQNLGKEGWRTFMHTTVYQKKDWLKLSNRQSLLLFFTHKKHPRGASIHEIKKLFPLKPSLMQNWVVKLRNRWIFFCFWVQSLRELLMTPTLNQRVIRIELKIECYVSTNVKSPSFFRSFVVIFLTPTFKSFTKLKIRWSF